MKRKLSIGMALVLMSLSLVGCEGWVTREDHEAVIVERDAAQTEVTSLQSDLGKAQSQIETLESDLSKAESQIKTLQDELTTVAEVLAISEMGHFFNRTLLYDQVVLTSSLRPWL